MPKTSRAWLLDWPDQPLALATCEVIEILDAPEIHPVPFGPVWCRGLVVWRERLLALAIPEHLAAYATDASSTSRVSVVIVTFQAKPLAPLQHAAIAVQSQPRQIEVSDSLDCELPDQFDLDVSALRACFSFEGRTLIVPELNAMFGVRVAA